MTTSSSPHRELQEYQRQHEEIRDRVVRLTEELTPEQFHHSPGPGRWSIAQNLEHLSLESEEQIENIRRSIGYPAGSASTALENLLMSA